MPLKRRTQKMFDSVTEQIKNQTQGGLKVNPETGVRYEEPLEEKHPGLAIGVMAAQPGTILEKLLAPSIYTGMLNSAKNGNLSEALVYGLAPGSKTWEVLTPRQVKWAAGHPERFTLLKAEGQGSHLPSSITNNRNSLVEKGVNEYGDPYIIRKNEFVKGGSAETSARLKRLERERAAERSYSGPDEWANSGIGSNIVRKRKSGGKLKRR